MANCPRLFRQPLHAELAKDYKWPVRVATIEYMLFLAEQLVSPAGRGVLP